MSRQLGITTDKGFIKNTIIPHKKELWSGQLPITQNSGNQSLTLTDTFSYGDRIEIVYADGVGGNTPEIYQSMITNANKEFKYVSYAEGSVVVYRITLSNMLNNKTIEVSALKQTPANISTSSTCLLFKIYKVMGGEVV